MSRIIFYSWQNDLPAKTHRYFLDRCIQDALKSLEKEAKVYMEYDRDKNLNDSLWVRCPICDGKTRTKVYADTVLVNFPLFCPKCKKEIRIDVVQLKMVISK